MRKAIRRGDLFYADLNPVVGSEQGGIRPVLVIQNDVGNYFSPTVVAAAITSRKAKNSLPTHILLENVPGLAPTSLLLLEQQPRSFIHNFAPEKSGEESRWLDGLRPDNTQLRMVRFDKVQNPLVLVCKVKFYINLFSLVNVNLFNQGNNNTAL